MNETEAGGKVMCPPSTDQASWLGSEGQPLQSGVLSVGILAQPPSLWLQALQGTCQQLTVGVCVPSSPEPFPCRGVHFRAAVCHSWLKEFVSQQVDRSTSALV